jgi:GTP-binding protein YchF
MQVGIVGLPFSGKTTLFNTLLVHRSQSHIPGKFKGETERGIVKVPDNRLEQLSSIFHPQKTIHATVEYIKVPGLEKDDEKSGGLPAQFLANTKTVDLILVMIRAFENDIYPHPMGSVAPGRDIRFIESEFLLNDLSIIENRIEKLEKLVMKTQLEKDKRELLVLKKCQEALEKEQAIRTLSLDTHEEMIIKGFQFLTAKPLLYVLNIEETKIAGSEEMVDQYKPEISTGCTITALSAEIEKEIAELDEQDAKDFLADLKIKEAATSKLIRASYDLLGLISFFTVGQDECRAWTIHKGTHAQQAAGTIHSDMEKGFIRAEVVGFETLVSEGGWQQCKEKGLLRLEGKDYQVKDGDILSIRFNV